MWLNEYIGLQDLVCKLEPKYHSWIGNWTTFFLVQLKTNPLTLLDYRVVIIFDMY